MTVEVIEADEALALGTVGCALIMVWTGEATTERMIRSTECVVALAARMRPGAVGVVMVIEHGAPLPSREDLERTLAMVGEIAPTLVGTVFVLEGGGAWAAEVLEEASDAHARLPELARKYCFGTAEASAWLSARLQGEPEAPSREQLRDAIVALRAAVRR